MNNEYYKAIQEHQKKNHHFPTDLALSHITQVFHVPFLQRYFPDLTLQKTEGYYAYDYFTEIKGKKIKLEIKDDKKSLETGNIFLPYESIMQRKVDFFSYFVFNRDKKMYHFYGSQDSFKFLYNKTTITSRFPEYGHIMSLDRIFSTLEFWETEGLNIDITEVNPRIKAQFLSIFELK